MFAKTFEVIRSMNRNVLKTLALAAFHLAPHNLVYGIQVLVLLETMITEAFSSRSYSQTS